MATNLEELLNAGITTGKVNQLPPSMDGRVDLSNIGKLQRTPSAPFGTSAPVPNTPLTGDQLQSLKWTGNAPVSATQNPSSPTAQSLAA
jgi:hypothetical protein